MLLISKETIIFFFGAIYVGCMYEFINLQSIRAIGTIGIVVSITPLLYILEHVGYYDQGRFTPGIGIILLMAAFSTGWDVLFFINIALGVMWCLPSMAICIHYCFKDPYLVIALMTIAWFTDGGAYMGGKLVGRTPLFQSVSPNKTIEGTLIGTLLALVVAYITSLVYTRLSLYDLIIISLLSSVFGQIGDLIESYFKRCLGVKDSGVFLAGHGGFLDRFDSIFLAIPMNFVYLEYLR